MGSPEAQKWHYSQRADLPAESLLLDTLPSYKTFFAWFYYSIFNRGTAPNSYVNLRIPSLLTWFRVDLQGMLLSGYSKVPTGVTLSFSFLSF